ncbi:hypothetical protein N9S91_01780 [Candidatus Pelagibacter sp.]|nr:hypothetical protein [Candidatus Pelagibacter sp.]
MPKVFYHNEKLVNQKTITKKLSKAHSITEKQVVDINKLLNRVKIDKRNENKKKFFFYSLTILALGFFSTFIMIIK